MQREHLVTGAELPFWSVITLTALVLYFGEWQESTVQLLYAGSLLLVLVLLISTSGNLLLVSRLGLMLAGTNKADIQLAGLLVLASELDSDMSSDHSEFLSRASKLSSRYHWSSAMAITYMINREVLDETIRISA